MAKTVKIPGGEAVLLDDPAELTPRRRRPLELVSARIGRRLPDIVKSARLFCDGDLIFDKTSVAGEDGEPKFTGDCHITEHEMEMMSRLNDALIVALLKSWTLDLPVPTSIDDVLDVCPADVYDALRVHASELSDVVSEDGFTPDAVEDPSSPTGA